MPRRRRKRRKRRRADPELIGPLLEDWLRKEQLLGDMLLYRLIERWPTLVGERIARRTRPTRLSRGRLTVSVASSAWLNELSFLKGGLLQRINQAFGLRNREPEAPPRAAAVGQRAPQADDPIKEMRLVIGRVSWRPRPVAAPPPTPPPPAREAVERALVPLSAELDRHDDLDEDLVRAIARARRMQLTSATRPTARPRGPRS